MIHQQSVEGIVELAQRIRKINEQSAPQNELLSEMTFYMDNKTYKVTLEPDNEYRISEDPEPYFKGFLYWIGCDKCTLLSERLNRILDTYELRATSILVTPARGVKE